MSKRPPIAVARPCRRASQPSTPSRLSEMVAMTMIATEAAVGSTRGGAAHCYAEQWDAQGRHERQPQQRHGVGAAESTVPVVAVQLPGGNARADDEHSGPRRDGEGPGRGEGEHPEADDDGESAEGESGEEPDRGSDAPTPRADVRPERRRRRGGGARVHGATLTLMVAESLSALQCQSNRCR
jgi:hypothetical protein